MLVRISSSRCPTLLDSAFLEGINRVRENLRANSRLHGVALDQIDARMEHVLQEVPNADKIIDAEVARFVQHDENIDIAPLPRLAARERAEDTRMEYAHRGETLAIRSENLQGAIKADSARGGFPPLRTLGDAVPRTICRLTHSTTIA